MEQSAADTSEKLAEIRKAYQAATGTPTEPPEKISDWDSTKFYRSLDSICTRLERHHSFEWQPPVVGLLNKAILLIPQPPDRHYKPVEVKVKPGDKQVACKKCGEEGLVWGTTRLGKRVLADPVRGTMHTC